MYFPEKFYKKHYVVWRIRVNNFTISQIKIDDVKNTIFVQARTRCNTREKNFHNPCLMIGGEAIKKLAVRLTPYNAEPILELLTLWRTKEEWSKSCKFIWPHQYDYFLGSESYSQ